MHLVGESGDELHAQRAGQTEIEAVRKAHAVVADDELDPLAVERSGGDGDRPGSPGGKRVLERVRDELVDDQADRCGSRDAHRDVGDVHVEAHGVADGVGSGELIDHVAYEALKVDAALRVRLIEELVDERHGPDPLDRGVDRLLHRRFPLVGELQPKQADDHVQVVLDSVVNLAEQELLVLRAAPQVVLQLLELGDVASRLDDIEHGSSRPKKTSWHRRPMAVELSGVSARARATSSSRRAWWSRFSRRSAIELAKLCTAVSNSEKAERSSR